MPDVTQLRFPGDAQTYDIKDAPAREQLIANAADILRLNGDVTSLNAMLARAENLTYQWQARTPTGSSWSDSSGNDGSGKTAVLSLTTKTWQDGYLFRCVITDANGGTHITDTLTLHVGSATGARTPQSSVRDGYIIAVSDTDLYAAANETVEMSAALYTFDQRILGVDLPSLKQSVGEIAANAAPTELLFAGAGSLSYQWQYQVVGNTSWPNSASTGSTTDTLTMTAKAYHDGYRFRCMIADIYGNIAYSAPITLHVGDVSGPSQPQANAQSGYVVTVGDTDMYAAVGEEIEIHVGVQTFNSAALTIAKPFALHGDFTTLYETPELDSVESGAAFDLAASRTADIYALYDALMDAHPESITRNLLGYASNAEGAADETLPIYEYVIDSRARALSDDSALAEKPTLLLNSGLHGGLEKATVWAGYQMVRAMFESNNSSLRAIKSNVKLRIVPIASPWSYDNMERTNARGVNLNRNFGWNWSNGSADSTSTEYRGEAAYSELETQALSKWLTDHPAAIYCIDYHNTFQEDDWAWICCRDDDTEHIAVPFSAAMSDYLCERYSLNTEKNLFRDSDETHAGLADECRIIGIKRHCCLEFNVSFGGTKYGASAIQLGVDVLVNFILAVLDRVKYMG